MSIVQLAQFSKLTLSKKKVQLTFFSGHNIKIYIVHTLYASYEGGCRSPTSPVYILMYPWGRY